MLNLDPNSGQARTSAATLPYLNLGLNDGTYMPEACIEVLRHFAHRTGLRHYTSAGNSRLREAISRVDGVSPENIFLHNGSGPILKQVIPAVIKDKIMSKGTRIAKHLLLKAGYPIVTVAPTYGKVVDKALKLGLRVDLIPMSAEQGFRPDPEAIAAHLGQRDSLFYLANPNNPTGNMLATRETIIGLLERFPETTFWIDEAYIQYADPDPNPSVSDLVPRYPNLCVTRTFSFAYGLAGARIGYLLANPGLVTDHDRRLTDYRLGILQEHLAIAALEDEHHLPYIRQVSAEGRAELTAGLSRHPVQVFPSVANFILCRFTDGRPAAPFIDALETRGIHIKSVEDLGTNSYPSYFRITLGLPAEHARLLEAVDEVLG